MMKQHKVAAGAAIAVMALSVAFLIYTAAQPRGMSVSGIGNGRAPYGWGGNGNTGGNGAFGNGGNQNNGQSSAPSTQKGQNGQNGTRSGLPNNNMNIARMNSRGNAMDYVYGALMLAAGAGILVLLVKPKAVDVSPLRTAYPAPGVPDNPYTRPMPFYPTAPQMQPVPPPMPMVDLAPSGEEATEPDASVAAPENPSQNG